MNAIDAHNADQSTAPPTAAALHEPPVTPRLSPLASHLSPITPRLSPLIPHASLLWGAASLAAAARSSTQWLWQGYLAAGAVTLLTSQWKAGKTTLASVLLARMKSGGLLAGLPVTAGKALVVSEEGPDHWQRRHERLDLADHVGWFCRPFRGKPTLPQWSAFIDGLADLHARLSFSLLLIDPWAAFLPGSENDASSMCHGLMPLQSLTARGVAVLILHHPRKGAPSLGQAARGSGALSGFADILIELRAYPKAEDADRRRRLWAASRYPETPRRLVIEWTADGSDYLAHGSFLDEEFANHWQALRDLLLDAPNKLDRAEILRRWPDDHPPDKITLNRWLERAVDQGLLRKDGRGLRNHAFRYWLPQREDQWRQDPFACLLMPELHQPLQK